MPLSPPLHLLLLLPAGAVVGIIGGNGAGKSTLFRMIMQKEQPDGGSVELGDTVVPMWVDQSRESLDSNKTVSCTLKLACPWPGGRDYSAMV